jgi:hypothetical protein
MDEWFGYMPGRRVTFGARREALAVTPAWPESEANPPLAVRDAVASGQRRLRALVDCEVEWVLASIELIEDSLAARWYYKLNFKQLRDQKGNDLVIMGKPYHLPVIVLMDGSAVEPVVQPDS